MYKRKGFTLAEMIAVLCAIAIIWSVVLGLSGCLNNGRSLKWVDPEMYQIQLQEEQLERLRQISIQNEELLRKKEEFERLP